MSKIHPKFLMRFGMVQKQNGYKLLHCNLGTFRMIPVTLQLGKTQSDMWRVDAFA